MHTTFSFSDWLEHVRCLLPISGVVHVGAGGGLDSLRYANWNVAQAVLIEADEMLADRLVETVKEHPSWSAHSAFISDGDGEATFYVASNANESGALKPETLTRFWRNLRTIEERPARTVTLDTLLAGLAVGEALNWAVVDCLPALPVLRGAEKLIAQADVIVARAFLDESQLPGEAGGKSELDQFLTAHGYRCLATEEENQPALGRLLYVRDWKTLLESYRNDHFREFQKVVKARDEQTRLAADRQAQINELTLARAEETKLNAERETDVRKLAQARDEQAKTAADRQAQIQELTQERDEQSKLAADRDAQTQKLAQERDKQAKLASEA
ncbi:MAG: hypothetical protein KDI53_19015, partial [Candidatus Accumulibacter sp.]|nr:hypothetical protein [Accumulibacter sp.]